MFFLTALFLGSAEANPFESNYTFDPAATRGLLLPTAQTLKKGQFTLSSVEILFFNANWGVTDNVNLSFTSLLPIMPVGFGGFLSARIKLLDSEKWTVSLEPSTLIATGDDALGGTIGLQLITDYAVDPSGRFILTGALNTQGLYGVSDVSSDIALADGALGIAGLGMQFLAADNLKLMGEFMIPVAVTEDGVTIEPAYTVANFGLRFISKQWAYDLSFIRPMELSGGFWGFPYFVATGRFN